MTRPAGTSVELGYGHGSLRVELPQAVRVEVVEPPSPPDAGDEGALVEAALDAPVGASRLEELARGARRATIVVPDGTRRARVEVVLPLVLARLARAGVDASSVHVLVGGGIHAPTTADEMASILGPGLPVGLSTGSTDADDVAAYADLGGEGPLPRARVHRSVVEADVVVLVGAVAPHYLAGFSGGAKALVPGTGDRDTVAAAHRLTLDATVAPDGSVRSWLGRPEGNSFRSALLRVARRLRSCWIVNVGTSKGKIAHASAGDVGAAFDEAVSKHRRLFAVPLPAPADLVIAGGGAPQDRDLLQGHKALVVAAQVAKPGAPVVWLVEAPEGAGHPRFLPWFETGKLERHLASLRRDFHPYGLTAYGLRWKAARFPVLAVSEVSPDVLRPMGLWPFPGAQAAVDHALRTHRVERCVVLPRASATFFA